MRTPTRSTRSASFWELSPRLPDGAILSVRLRLGGELVRARPASSAAG